MRILIAGSTYPPQINGQSIFTGNLANSMNRLGHDVMVMTPSDTGRPSRRLENGILRWSVRSLDLSLFHTGFFIAFGYEDMLNEALDTFQPDIIHLQDSAPLNRCLLRLARRRRIPVVITHHIGPAVGAPYFTWFTSLLGGRMEGVVWRWIISFLNRADVLTAPSKAAAGMLRQHRVIPPVWPISCGVFIEDFLPDRSIGAASYFSKSCPTFLYVGRLDWEKRPDVILRAMALLPHNAGQLIIAGTGAAEKDLKDLAEELHLTERVHFLGDVQHDHINDLYHACDVFVMPGDAESLSIATLEAMAAGKPILAADSMALPELVEAGVNGLLFQPRNHQHAAEQMQWFLDHPQEWKRMGQISLQRASGHSIPAVMSKFEGLYRNTVMHHARHRPQPSTQPALSSFYWLSQRLLPHLKALVLLVFLVIFSGMMYSETIAAPQYRLENMQTFDFATIQRIMVLSPHPDDVVLAAGGFVQSAIEHGVTVQTVIVTNGEQPVLSPALLYSDPSYGELSTINLCKDTLAALAELGIQDRQAIFLDYPSGQWEIGKPTSAIHDHHQGITAQAALFEDLRQLYAAYPPDVILIPHPEDTHLDHKAVSQAARSAAVMQFYDSAGKQPLILGYLIDYETYPDSIDLIDLSPLLPPAGLSESYTAWFNIVLDQNQIQGKRKAIQHYPFEGSRLAWMLISFSRSNEIFMPLTIQHMPAHMPPDRSNQLNTILYKQLAPVEPVLFDTGS
jgi:glycosyltransferase involved in cell wall biosynthesis/LmbE family N-acetylglucosaminyl deacetylase